MTQRGSGRGASPDRRIPGWAAGLLGRLARNRPVVVARRDLEAMLAEAGSARSAGETARELQRLGWLVPVHLRGVWAYLPPGEDELVDPYVDLRAWQARDPGAVLALAGEAAAWHLGYVDRAFAGPVAVWIPGDSRLPYGLRSHVSVVTLGWRAADAGRLGPAPQLLRARHLDLTRWAAGLPAFGPEALMVQLASRPASFRVWADLITHLDQLAGDCDPARLVGLLGGQSASAWQRAAYVLARGGRRDAARAVLEQRPPGGAPKVQFGSSTGPSVWDGEFGVADHIVAPLQAVAGKA